MATLPPSPLGAFSRTIWSKIEGLQRNLEHNFDFVYDLATDMNQEWRRFQIGCDNLTNIDTADDAIITLDVVNYTAGAIDSTWETGDYQDVVGAIDLMLTGLIPHMSPSWRFNRVRAYVMKFNPAWPGSPPTEKISPFVPSTQPDYDVALGRTGTGTGTLPPQVACTITEMVPLRKHWGRFYVPGIAKSSCIDGTGRFLNPTAFATAANNAYQNLAGVEMYPVVVSTQENKERVAALQQVTNLRCDDVFDVQRSRRYAHSTALSTLPALAAQLLPAGASPPAGQLESSPA